MLCWQGTWLKPFGLHGLTPEQSQKWTTNSQRFQNRRCPSPRILDWMGLGVGDLPWGLSSALGPLQLVCPSKDYVVCLAGMSRSVSHGCACAAPFSLLAYAHLVQSVCWNACSDQFWGQPGACDACWLSALLSGVGMRTFRKADPEKLPFQRMPLAVVFAVASALAEVVAGVATVDRATPPLLQALMLKGSALPCARGVNTG